MPSVRDYLWWTAPGSPTKYADLTSEDEDTWRSAMLYMSVNTSLWGLWAYKTKLEKSMFVRNIGLLATSPHLAAISMTAGVVVGAAIFGYVAAEAGGYDRMVGITPSGDPSIMQGVFNRWTRNF